jgi:signal transduction histidine kinase
MVWLQVLSNLLIGLAYVSISLTLYYIVRRIRDIPFQWVYWAFGIFIISCGLTHFMDVLTVWSPFYWIDGSIRAVTAVASVGTGALLFPLVPRAIALADTARIAHERGLQIETANRELESLYERSKELEQQKTQFFANISHELRTPLALILGPVEGMADAKNLQEDQRRDLAVIGRNARILLKHVNDLLDVSKLEAGKMVADYSEINLGQLARLVCSNFDALAAERKLSFEVAVPRVLSAQLDSEKCQKILMNLLSNAFKFTSAGGRVRCSLSGLTKNGGAPWARLEVADSGPGIPPSQRAVVFERFRQLDGSATRPLGGTGLGLAIAKDFTVLQGGHIEVGTAPEGGALFFVELPLNAPKDIPVRSTLPGPGFDLGVGSQDLVGETHPEGSAREIGKDRERALVLVIEDNPDMNRFVCEALSSEFRVAAAFDGQEGYERALAAPPDLIVSDVMMPRLSGEDLVGKIRQVPDLDGIPILLLTARADHGLREKLLRQGAQDYLVKPFSTRELRARAANLATTKRAREILQRELAVQVRDLDALALEMTHRKRELQTAVEATQVAREQAERASKAKSDFLSLVTHELRTPLTGLMLQLARLRRDRDSTTPKQQALFESVTSSSKRLATLIESVLEYSRVESGHLEIHPDDLDLAHLVSEIIDEQRPLANERRLALSLSSSQDLPALHSDRRLIHVVVGNLVGNAIKFTERGSVDVALRFEDGQHVIQVTDTGPGIPQSQQRVIFEPFRHIEPLEGKRTTGFGLGLALVKEVVTALGGRLEMVSTEGKGSAFTVLLPALPKASPSKPPQVS